MCCLATSTFDILYSSAGWVKTRSISMRVSTELAEVTAEGEPILELSIHRLTYVLLGNVNLWYPIFQCWVSQNTFHQHEGFTRTRRSYCGGRTNTRTSIHRSINMCCLATSTFDILYSNAEWVKTRSISMRVSTELAEVTAEGEPILELPIHRSINLCCMATYIKLWVINKVSCSGFVYCLISSCSNVFQRDVRRKHASA